jgi:hypothetical protein
VFRPIARSDPAQALVVDPPPPDVVDVLVLLDVAVVDVAAVVDLDELLELPHAASTGISAASETAQSAPMFPVLKSRRISHSFAGFRRRQRPRDASCVPTPRPGV